MKGTSYRLKNAVCKTLHGDARNDIQDVRDIAYGNPSIRGLEATRKTPPRGAEDVAKYSETFCAKQWPILRDATQSTGWKPARHYTRVADGAAQDAWRKALARDLSWHSGCWLGVH